MQVPGGGVPSASPVRRKTDRIAFPWAVPAAKERGDRGRWNYPSQATAAFEMVLSPGAGRTSAAGGLPFLSPANPDFSLLFCPHPPDPLPGGKGETISLFCRGLRPRHPGIRPFAARTAPAMQVPGGGLAFLAAVLPCRCDTRRGACLLCRPPTLPLALFLPPSPRPPSRREGGAQSYFMQGAPPLASPG